jgi:hypothetical protein
MTEYEKKKKKKKSRQKSMYIYLARPTHTAQYSIAQVKEEKVEETWQ